MRQHYGERVESMVLVVLHRSGRGMRSHPDGVQKYVPMRSQSTRTGSSPRHSSKYFDDEEAIVLYPVRRVTRSPSRPTKYYSSC